MLGGSKKRSGLPPRKPRARKRAMTVCLAAICNRNMIFGASDRMLTSGDIEFEVANSGSPPSKIVTLTSSISAMLAGDAGLQREILRDVSNTLNDRIKKEPNNWWRVKDVVEVYVGFYNATKLRRAVSAVLSPYGLDEQSFVHKQREMSDAFVRKLVQEMESYSLPGVETIIAGIDLDGGPHIYTIHGNYVSCADPVGFAAIGSGSRHSESQFMLAGHEPAASADETLFLTYLAKKRAEIAPGVGEYTDMIGIGPQLGAHAFIRREIVDHLDTIYQKHIKSEKQVAKRSREAATKYAKQLQAAADAKPATPQEPPPSGPTAS